MADLVWPAGIEDRPLRQGVNYQPMSNQDSFEPDEGAGFDITWVKAAAAPLRMSPTWCMDPVQFERWLSWWQIETKGGTIPFQLRDPYDLQSYFWKLQPGQQITVDKPWPLEVRVSIPLQRVP